MNPSPGTRHPSRILVRSTNWLGDAVMSTPALMRLREKFPGAHIALLTPEKLRELWLHHSAVDETISFAPAENIFSIGKRLRAGKFDLALVLPNSPRSAMEVFCARIPQRIGYARPWRNFFLTQTVSTRPGHAHMRKRSVAEIRKLVAAEGSQRQNSDGRVLPNAATGHQIHEYLHLVGALGANPEPLPPQLSVTDVEVEAAKKKFGLDKITTPIFGLNPSAEYGPAKRWPAERFTAAAKEIQQRSNCVWLIFGGKGDVEIANQIESAIGNRQSAISLSGQTSLRQLMSLLKICRVLLTNDTGPMHVAAALGTPVVTPFGSTSPELTGPGLPDASSRQREEADVSQTAANPPPHVGGYIRHALLKSEAPCSPCFLRECPIDFRCMKGISVERVVEAVLKCV